LLDRKHFGDTAAVGSAQSVSACRAAGRYRFAPAGFKDKMSDTQLHPRKGESYRAIKRFR